MLAYGSHEAFELPEEKPLGRLRSLSGVWLREAITLADIQASPHKELQTEILRLENIERDTIRSWTVEYTPYSGTPSFLEPGPD